MASVNVYYAAGNFRSKLIAQAMTRGIRMVCNDKAKLLPSTYYRGVDSDIAVFYGLAEGLHRVFQEYSKYAKAVYVDLGYWHRRINTKYDGYHKVVVNGRHPTPYFQQVSHPKDRFQEMHIDIKPWRKGGSHVLIAGMSGKAAAAEGLIPEYWERNAVAQIKKLTERTVVYRPKPNYSNCHHIQGAVMQRNVELQNALINCHAVATHHSNVAVDAILAGVPAFCVEGVASPMSCDDLSKIEEPWMPDNRIQWASDIAYCQWSMVEIQNGLPWKHLKKEGLIP